jgi:hypothetical protein
MALATTRDQFVTYAGASASIIADKKSPLRRLLLIAGRIFS